VKRSGWYGTIALLVTILLAKYLPAGWITWVATAISAGVTFLLLLPVLMIPLGSLFFKFRDRDWLFEKLPLTGSEKVLDVGCGHGLLLIAAAKKLTSGIAYGLDLWAQATQANNSKEATLKNARIAGLESKIEIHTGDMRAMPFADSSFDAIVSSWAIHNIDDKNEREKALLDILRVLKPGGRIAILDIYHAPSYRAFFVTHNLKNVQLLGPHFTFGNRTYLVLATKP